MRSGRYGRTAVMCVRRSAGFAAALALVLGACADDSPEVREPALDEVTYAAVATDTLEGLLRIGEHGLTLQACDSEDEAWVVEAAGADLRQAAAGLSVDAGSPVRARFLAAPADPPADGPGAAYDHAVLVTQWVFLAEDMGRCAEEEGAGSEPGPGTGMESGAEPEGEGRIPSLPDHVLLRALGNEPFWTVDVERGVVRITRLGNDDLEFPGAESVPDGTSRTWSGENEEHRFELTIEEEPCPDTMVDRTYPLTALLTLDAQQLNGCAFEAIG